MSEARLQFLGCSSCDDSINLTGFLSQDRLITLVFNIADENITLKNPSRDTFEYLMSRVSNKSELLKGIYACTLMQVPVATKPFEIQYTKLRLLVDSSDAKVVNTYIDRSWKTLEQNYSITELQSKCWGSLKAIAETYPQDMVDAYYERLGGN